MTPFSVTNVKRMLGPNPLQRMIRMIKITTEVDSCTCVPCAGRGLRNTILKGPVGHLCLHNWHGISQGLSLTNHRTTSNLTQRRVAPPGETYIVYLLKVAGKKISEFPDHDATGNAQAGHGSDRMLLLQSSSRPNPRCQQLPHTSATRE